MLRISNREDWDNLRMNLLGVGRNSFDELASMLMLGKKVLSLVVEALLMEKTLYPWELFLI